MYNFLIDFDTLKAFCAFHLLFLDIFSISFLGKGGGPAKQLSSEHIVVPSNNVMRIQESHLFLTHYLADLIEKRLSSQYNE